MRLLHRRPRRWLARRRQRQQPRSAGGRWWCGTSRRWSCTAMNLLRGTRVPLDLDERRSVGKSATACGPGHRGLPRVCVRDHGVDRDSVERHRTDRAPLGSAAPAGKVLAGRAWSGSGEAGPACGGIIDFSRSSTFGFAAPRRPHLSLPSSSRRTGVPRGSSAHGSVHLAFPRAVRSRLPG